MKRNFKYRNLRSYCVSMTLFSSLILTLALITEYVFDYNPCILCLYERIPYMAIFTLSLLSILASGMYIITLRMNIVSCFTSIMLAIYHFGVEQDLFEGPIRCNTNLPSLDSKTFDDTINVIYNINAVSCKIPSLTVFGLSMAFWNIILSAILLFYSIRIYIKSKPRDAQRKYYPAYKI